MTSWRIQTRTGRSTWSLITVEAASLGGAIRLAERLTGGTFVCVEA